MSESEAGSSRGLPEGLLLSFYGDDFTGSTSVMEALTFAGLPTVLFLDVPTAAQLERFAAYRAVGIAGVARSQSPAWMDAHLPPIFRALAALSAPIAHYKVCSTFNSAPHVGSIGHAIDLAAPLLGGDWHPLFVAAPSIERYQALGNLFAMVGGVGYRLDRHPTMSRHPVTPMHEADVRRHLAKQTARSIGLVDFLAMKRGKAGAALNRERDAGAEIIALDVVDDETLAEAGRLIWEWRGNRLFAIGSQGLEDALVAHWRRAGLIQERSASEFRAASVARIACVSGSCSPVTAAQIAHAAQNGFATIRLDASLAVDGAAWEAELGRVEQSALAVTGEGRDPLVFTAAGPDDPAIARMAEAVETSGTATGLVNDRVGAGLGRLLDRVMREADIRRAVIAGGDTSGHAALTLGIHALTAISPIAPGAPLCLAHSDDPTHARREVALKGGQIGAPDFFSAVRNGGGRDV